MRRNRAPRQALAAASSASDGGMVMSEPRSFASLSSGLLARKGAAKPAMRPQGFGQFGTGLEDLGWNDMGHAAPPAALAPASAPGPVPVPEELPHHVPSSIAALTPAPRPEEARRDEPEPPVVEQQRAIAQRFREEEPEEAAPAPAPKGEIVTLPRNRAKPSKAKAAFTLRLDADRHLRLRLASAVTGRSSQKIVTEALDKFLATHPELDGLADHVPARLARRN